MKVKPIVQRLVLLSAGISLMAQTASATPSIINRYSFSESGGTTVTDSVRGSNGVVRVLTAGGGAGALPTLGGGKVTLDGVGGYVDLPNGMISGLTNVTLEFWATMGPSGGTWTRYLDFGNSSIGEDTNGSVASGTGGQYLFVSPLRGGAFPGWAITTNPPPGNGQENPIQTGPVSIVPDAETHIVVTYGPTGGARFYVDGNIAATGNYGVPLSGLVDVNCWLGRSQWGDPYFPGNFNEFRIHNTLLTQLEVLASKASGPDTINYTPENPTSIVLNVNSNQNSGQFQNATLTGVFPTYGTVTVAAAEAVLVSSNPNVVAVGANNRLTAGSPGTATITATLGGQSSQAQITVILPVAAVNVIKHRYSFNEASGATTAIDSIAGANATVFPPISGNPVVISNGAANFPISTRATSGYIGLPPNMLSSEFTNLTVEFWFTWNGNPNSTWQRVFDFGNSDKGTDPHVNAGGRDYVTWTPQRGGSGGPQTEFRATLDAGASYTAVQNQAAPVGIAPFFPTNQEMHVVVTVAPEINYSAMYINGFRQNIGGTPLIGGQLVQFNQVSSPNMWLGVSAYNDTPLNGRINEFRMHEGLLDEVQIALSRKAGPNSLPITNPGPLQSIALQAPPLYINDTTPTQATLLGTFQNAADVDITPLSGVTLQSADTNIFTITSTGLMLPKGVGTANLIGTYNSLSTTSLVSVLAPTSVTVTNLPVTLDVGNPAHSPYTVPLLASFPGGINNVNVTAFTGVTRSSSSTSVATVTAAGVVTVLAPGTTTITSAYFGQTNQAVLTVIAPSSVYVTNLPATRDAGSVNFTIPLLATYPDGNTDIVVTAAAGVVRTSSDTTVATITGGGNVTVRSPGQTTITSTYQGKSTQGILTVVTPSGFTRGTLLNRYSFDGFVDEPPDPNTGFPKVTDSVGAAHGEVWYLQTGSTNGNFTGTGQFMMGPGPYQNPPVTNAYINLPNGLISNKTSVTIEGWFTYFGGAANQRIFDFGISSGAPDGTGGTNSWNYIEDYVANPGRNYFFLAPGTNPRFAFDPDTGNTGIGETPNITSSIAITTGARSHFAVVYDFPRGVARLYINGQRAGTGAAVYPLSRVDDRNAWLGRSNWQDPFANLSLDEFRIYDGPFLDTDIAAHFAGGPNTLVSYAPALSIVAETASSLTFAWPIDAGNFTLQQSTQVGAGASWSPAGAATVVGANYQLTVPVSSAGNRYYQLKQ